MDNAMTAPRDPRADPVQTHSPLAVVILAKDEAQVLTETLRRVMLQLGGGDEVHVVADGCRDSTAETARRAGARVYERPARGRQGKGAALAWWLRRTHGAAPADQIIIVLDADSLALPGCLDALRRAVEQGVAAAQAQIVPVVTSTSPTALLAALSEIADQNVGDAIRVRLTWPVRLRGTGMAFRRSVLEQLAPLLSTAIEDAELTLLMAAGGLCATWVPGAKVEDPKPGSARFAAKQRARWLKGQLQLVTAQSEALRGTLAQGIPGWSLVASILLRPKVFTLPVFALASVLFWSASAESPWFLPPALFLGAWAMVGVASLVLALAWSPAPYRMLRALLMWPLYVLLWLRSAALALRTDEAWPRARPLDAPTRPAGEPGHAG